MFLLIKHAFLQVTRLGKYINHLRRKTNNGSLARRLKNLLKRWREMIIPSEKKNNASSFNGIKTKIIKLFLMKIDILFY